MRRRHRLVGFFLALGALAASVAYCRHHLPGATGRVGNRFEGPPDQGDRGAPATSIANPLSTREPTGLTKAGSQGEPTLVVVVDAEDKRPILGALVSTSMLTSKGNAGRTGRDGTLSLRIVEGDTQIAVEAIGYERHLIPVEYPGLPLYRVELARGGEIRGRVLWAADGSSQEKAVVLAWPAGLVPEQDTVRSAVLHGEPRRDLWHARTGAGGGFSLGGLPEGVPVTLSAAAPGGICTDRLHTAADVAEPVELLLRPVYGAAVRLRGEDGSRLVTTPRLFGDGPTTRCRDSGVDLVEGTPVELVIAAPGLPDDVSEDYRDDKLLLYTTAERRPRVGPIEYGVRVPGYVPLDSEVHAYPLHQSFNEVVLTPIAGATQWGTLRITVNLSPSEVHRNEDSPLGMVRLLEDDGRPSNIAVHRRATDVVEGVPCGVFAFQFKVMQGYFHYPPWNSDRRRVVVCPEIGDIVIETAGTGSIQLLFETSKGQYYQGEVALRCFDTINETTFFARWRRAPYTIELVPLGAYLLKVERLEGRDAASIEEVMAYVSPEEVFVWTFVIP
jgi:hypothetical protein